MQRIVVITLIALITGGSIAAAQLVERYSNNPLPKLNIVGIGMAEDLTTAKHVVGEIFKDKMNVTFLFPTLADPTYKKLKSQSAFGISFGGKSASGRAFSAAVDSVLELNANNFTVLAIDRKGIIRAHCQSTMFDPRHFNRLVEELLLNLDGKEAITVDETSPFQTTLAKEKADAKPKALFTLGKGREFYAYLGKPLPSFSVKTFEGSDIALPESFKGKVTLLFVFAASEDHDALVNSAGTMMMAKLMNAYYQMFTLGQGTRGSETVKNAVPDSSTTK